MPLLDTLLNGSHFRVNHKYVFQYYNLDGQEEEGNSTFSIVYKLLESGKCICIITTSEGKIKLKSLSGSAHFYII